MLAHAWERCRLGKCGIVFAPAGRLGMRQQAAAFEYSPIFEDFAKSASELAHSEKKSG